MQDATGLETRGRPTAVVITGAFVDEARTQAAALGMPDLAPVVVDHPLSTLTEAQVVTRVGQALAQIDHRLLSA